MGCKLMFLLDKERDSVLLPAQNQGLPYATNGLNAERTPQVKPMKPLVNRSELPSLVLHQVTTP